MYLRVTSFPTAVSKSIKTSRSFYMVRKIISFLRKLKASPIAGEQCGVKIDGVATHKPYSLFCVHLNCSPEMLVLSYDSGLCVIRALDAQV